jgi:hypothetical protein
VRGWHCCDKLPEFFAQVVARLVRGSPQGHQSAVQEVQKQFSFARAALVAATTAQRRATGCRARSTGGPDRKLPLHTVIGTTSKPASEQGGCPGGVREFVEEQTGPAVEGTTPKVA